MRVEVRIHRIAEEQLQEWLFSQDPANQYRDALVREYYDELVRALTRWKGEIPNAECMRSAEPRIYRWKYSEELWVEFVVKRTTRLFGQFESRKIIVTAFEPVSETEDDS